MTSQHHEWFAAGECKERYGSSDPREADYFLHPAFARQRDDGAWELAYRADGEGEPNIIAEVLPGDDLEQLLKASAEDGYDFVWARDGRAFEPSKPQWGDNSGMWTVGAAHKDDRSLAMARNTRREPRPDSKYDRTVYVKRLGRWTNEEFIPNPDGACIRSWGDDFQIKGWEAAIRQRL